MKEEEELKELEEEAEEGEISCYCTGVVLLSMRGGRDHGSPPDVDVGGG